MKKITYGVILSLIVTFKLCCQETIIFFDESVYRYIGKNINILEDRSQTLQFNEVVKKNNSFINSKNEVPNMGVTNSCYWIKFRIKNISNSNLMMLELAYPLMNEIALYDNYKDNRYLIHRSGDNYKFSNRKYNHQNYLFDLNINKNETKVYYLKVQSKEQLLIPLSIISPQNLAESLIISDTISGIQFGILIVMILYNLFIYFIVNDKSYLYYVSYIFFFGLMQATLQGYGFKYLWPNFPWFANHSVIIFPAMGGIFAIVFLRNFLQTKVYVPKHNKIFPVFITVYLVAICLSLSDYNILSHKLIDTNALLLSLFIIYIAYTIARKKYKPAYFFLAAWTILLLGVTVFTLRNFGILPFNHFTNYIIQIGSALEVIILSFALADRINILKKEKEESQLEMLIALQENKNLITEQNIVLEKKVHERTQALEVANIELGVTLSNLKDTQSQLVDAEKMASLGQLTAGIAHEINNPINFVSANVKPLKMDIKDVFDVLTKYESLTPNDQLEHQLKDIETFKNEIDINYIKNEIDQLLSGIEDGAKRTAEIVSGLKNFSRLDESDLKLANLNDGIKSTLVLIRSNIPDYIKLTMNLGDIPSVECYPGKLNQVFMNIFNNAIDAMVQKKTQQKHELTIATYTDGENVCVTIVDTGMGMKPEVKAKIFEPFFTTKDVGSGTGLGMSIVFKIMESHHGRIEIESEYESGTKIILTLHKKIELL